MTTHIVMLAICVSLANTMLNKLAAQAAAAANDWHSIFLSTPFAIAFCTGLASLAFMFSFYFFGKGNQIGMANGVLVMGAISIICGTLIGFFYLKNSIHWSEWAIFFLILLFIAIRFSTAPATS